HKEMQRSLSRKFTVVHCKLGERIPDPSPRCCQAEGSTTPWKSAGMRLEYSCSGNSSSSMCCAWQGQDKATATLSLGTSSLPTVGHMEKARGDQHTQVCVLQELQGKEGKCQASPSRADVLLIWNHAQKFSPTVAESPQAPTVQTWDLT
ncbi:hypothetical protein EK904_006714, partial [Melospiza melodia maxima]